MTQVGLIGNMIKPEMSEDLWGTVESMARIGYKGIELMPLLLEGDAKANVRRFEDLGLKVISYGAKFEKLRDELPTVIKESHILKTDQVFMSINSGRTREEILREIDFYNSVGAALAREGLKFCYHNHEHEFELVFNGVHVYDMILDRTDPASVHLEFDIGWASLAGHDPAKLIRRIAGRIPTIHIKDLSSFAEKGHFTSAGTGLVDIIGSAQAAIETGVKWMVIEQDKLRNLTTMETLTASYLYLKEAGLV